MSCRPVTKRLLDKRVFISKEKEAKKNFSSLTAGVVDVAFPPGSRFTQKIRPVLLEDGLVRLDDRFQYSR